MSDTLTPDQLTALEAALQTLRQALLASLNSNPDAAAIVDLDQPIGRVSRIDAIQQQKMAQASKARARVRLGRVEASLSACKQGEYGLCRSCDDDIGYPRLQARPDAAFCLACQREFENARR